MANLVQALMVAALFGFQVLIALYLQNVQHYSAARTGLAMLPAALTIAAVSLFAGPVDYVTDLLPTMLAAGGFGLAITALTSLGMSGARPDDAGLASGLFNTTQQVGAAVGVAVLSTLAASRSSTLASAGTGQAAALTGGFHLAFGTGAALLLTALLVAATVLRTPPAPAPSDTEASDAGTSDAGTRACVEV